MGFSADPYRPLFSVWRHYPGSVLSETELVCPILTHKGAQSTLFYRLTQSGHYPLIIAQIVNGIEAGAEYFLAFVQMMKVSPEKF